MQVDEALVVIAEPLAAVPKREPAQAQVARQVDEAPMIVDTVPIYGQGFVLLKRCSRKRLPSSRLISITTLDSPCDAIVPALAMASGYFSWAMQVCSPGVSSC